MAPSDFTAAREHIESIIGYMFTRKSLLFEALYAAAPIYIDGKRVRDQNKRLAIVGDAALDLALTATDYPTTPSKGGMDDRRQSVAGNANLSAVGLAHDIDHCIIVNAGSSSVTTYQRATAVEAILGAVFLDCGDFKVVKGCIEKLGLLEKAGEEDDSK